MGRRKCRSCCAPCGFGCDPCLCELVIDAGTCGGVTFTYEQTDPCTGILTQVSPNCTWQDCYLDACIATSKTLIVDNTCETTPTCQAEFATPADGCGGSLYRVRWTYQTREVKIWAHTVTHRKYEPEIIILGDKNFLLRVVVTTYVHVYQHRWRRNRVYVGPWACRSTPSCATVPITTYTLLSENEAGDSTGGTTTCSYTALPFPSAYKCSPVGANLFTVSRLDTCQSPSGTFYGYTNDLTCVQIYEKEITLADCDAWADTYTLDLVSDPCNKSITPCAYEPTALGECPSFNEPFTVDNDGCSEITLAVTINAICVEPEP